MPKAKRKKSETLVFEDALAELDAIVRELESGDTELAVSLEKYERGVTLLKQCHQELQQAERKIELLTGIDDEGNAIVTPVEDAASKGAIE